MTGENLKLKRVDESPFNLIKTRQLIVENPCNICNEEEDFNHICLQHEKNQPRLIEKDLETIKNKSICLNDRVLLYVRYGCWYFDMNFNSKLDVVRKTLRIEDFEMKNPKSVAVGLLCLNFIYEGKQHTQQELATLFNIHVHTVRKSYLKLKQFIENEWGGFDTID